MAVLPPAETNVAPTPAVGGNIHITPPKNVIPIPPQLAILA